MVDVFACYSEQLINLQSSEKIENSYETENSVRNKLFYLKLVSK